MIRRLWVLYCFANKTTEQRLVELIESKKDNYHIVPLSSSSNASDVIKETLNNDRARNIGLKKSLEEGVEWALNLDGAQIMSQEGIQSLDKALKRAEENSQIFHFVPLIRLWFKIEFSKSLNYRQLFPMFRVWRNAQLLCIGDFCLSDQIFGFFTSTKGCFMTKIESMVTKKNFSFY